MTAEAAAVTSPRCAQGLCVMRWHHLVAIEMNEVPAPGDTYFMQESAASVEYPVESDHL